MPADAATHQNRLRAFDPAGDLPARAAALWAAISGDERAVARAFWTRYRETGSGQRSIDDAILDQLAERILPYIREKCQRLGETGWVHTAKSYVEDAMQANVSLTTLLAGLSGEAEALITAMRSKY